MKLIYKYLLKKYNQEHNQTMIRLGRSWLKAVRIHMTEYVMSDDVFRKEHHLKQATKYLSYAENYLESIK